MRNFFLGYILFCVVCITNVSALDKIKSNEISSESQVSSEKLQILANKISTKENIITATDNVLIHSPEYYITADKVIYNKDKVTLELFDNVNIIKNGKNITFTNYAFLDFSNETNNFVPLLLVDSTNNIWINSSKAKKETNIMTLKKSTLSSCDCYDPAWSISFTSGDYNTTEQWLNTYNTTLFLNELPVFYTPYFGFSTDKRRRSGLLKPTIGYSNIEGWLYAQPIYYAPSANYDFEYIPQIRTSRGNGHQIKYRFKDSTNSYLEVEAGLFNEDKDYQEEFNLRNKKHYGWDLKYEKSSLVSNENIQDGLLISLHSVNDIDYINTKYDSKGTSSDKLLESKIKYFYNTNSIYSDIDFKYYKDTSKENNEETMQELPKLHIHKYSTETFINNLLYSVDTVYSNKTRTIGLEASTTSVFIPLTYSFKLLNDYLNIAYSEQFSLVDIRYGNNTSNYQNGQFLENKHILNLSTEVLKPYEDYVHTINFKTSLTVANTIKKEGDIYLITNDNSDLSIAPVSKTKKNVNLELTQLIYNKNTLSQVIRHKINQPITYDDNDTSTLANLENELTYYYKYGSLSNRILFNHEEDLVISSSTTSHFSKDNTFFNLYYTENLDTPSTTQKYKDMPTNRTVKYDLGTSFSKYYKISYKEEYDLVSEISKIKEYVFDINKKCWGLNIKLADNLVASATTTNKALRQNIIYMQLVLKPITTINQKYVQKAKEE